MLGVIQTFCAKTSAPLRLPLILLLILSATLFKSYKFRLASDTFLLSLGIHWWTIYICLSGLIVLFLIAINFHTQRKQQDKCAMVCLHKIIHFGELGLGFWAKIPKSRAAKCYVCAKCDRLMPANYLESCYLTYRLVPLSSTEVSFVFPVTFDVMNFAL